MGNQKWIQCWAYYDVPAHSKLYELQEKLDKYLPKRYTKIEDLHVTIHPQYQFPEHKKQSFDSLVMDHFPSQCEFGGVDLYFYPNRSNPRVICIEVFVTDSISFEEEQELLSKKISANGAKNNIDPCPVKPHITLFSTNDPEKEMSRLPAHIDKVYDICDNFQEKQLPITIEQSELQIEPIQPTKNWLR